MVQTLANGRLASTSTALHCPRRRKYESSGRQTSLSSIFIFCETITKTKNASVLPKISCACGLHQLFTHEILSHILFSTYRSRRNDACLMLHATCYNSNNKQRTDDAVETTVDSRTTARCHHPSRSTADRVATFLPYVIRSWKKKTRPIEMTQRRGRPASHNYFGEKVLPLS